MEPHVERMFTEQTELCEKIDKLGAFINENPIFNKLPKEEQYDMYLQLEAMTMYSNILQHRLDRATAPKE